MSRSKRFDYMRAAQSRLSDACPHCNVPSVVHFIGGVTRVDTQGGRTLVYTWECTEKHQWEVEEKVTW